MQYLKVSVADQSYHGAEPLTYSNSNKIAPGAVVKVPLKRKSVLGIVISETTKPSFSVKPVSQLVELPPLPPNILKFIDWVAQYYPAPSGIITQLVMPRSLPLKPLPTDTLPPPDSGHLPPLTKDQTLALAQINAPRFHMLHGETGTGKTRVYIELALQHIRKGKSVIILTPEIGLTPQLARDFKSVFGNRVIVVHSKLTDVTRSRLWQYTLQQSQPLIVIGARSALFYPLKNLGLIVVDEEHESAYKQDQLPYYHATPAAAALANINSATLVLGSATPLIADYFLAKAKNRPIIKMSGSALGKNSFLNKVSLIDLKDRSLFGKSQHLSNELVESIAASLQSNEQSLVFLNRRGTARVVFCEKCAWRSDCPHCDLPLVYHSDTHRMRCHSCGFNAQTPSGCPECKNATVVFKTVGTKAIVEDLERLFPEARIMRFDTDNKKNERIEQHYEDLRSGKINIVVGTQTLAKGLDLPQLSTVGIAIADTSLYLPDFSAQERTYQLLVQVMGRVRRGHKDGHVIVQTYTPKNPLISAAIKNEWDKFYAAEIKERQQFLFPPFCFLLKLTCKRASSASASTTAAKLADNLRRTQKLVVVEGPAPCFYERSGDKFAWQIIVKSKNRATLTQIIKSLPSGWSYDIDPTNLL